MGSFQIYYGQYLLLVFAIAIINKINTMIETIIQMNQIYYPFHEVQDCPNVKVEDIFNTSSRDQLLNQKKRFQIIKNINHPSLINLNQIYQEGLILHLIYEYVPYSLSNCIVEIIRNQQYKNHQNNKTIMKNIAFQIGKLCDFFALKKIKSDINYNNIGLTNFTQLGSWKIKYFLGSNFCTFEGKKQELIDHYMKQKKSILMKLQKQIAMQKKSEYLPNFIIQGNKLIFTDELSETTQKKPKSQFCSDQKYQRSQSNYYDKNWKTPHHQYGKSKGKWGSKTRQKKHKNSQNFESNIFEQQKLNKSFDEQSENISVTQTKSMRIEFEQQQNKNRKRKNSYKFRITTFQEISIDQDEPINNFQPSEFFMGQTQTHQMPQTSQQFDEKGQKKETKNYRDKVNQAKVKATNILNNYLKSKKKN